MDKSGFDELIEAFFIFKKYENPRWPTHCEHDKLCVLVDPELVSVEDLARLDSLGFSPDVEDSSIFVSYRYGAA